MNIKQADIWFVNFDPSIGAEIQKQRPCVVINDDRVGRFGLKIVAPVTNWKGYFVDFPWIIKVTDTPENGLKKLSGIECFQIKSFSEERFVRKIGTISFETIRDIHETVLKTFNPSYNIK
jgi:mRNA interferase MazF